MIIILAILIGILLFTSRRAFAFERPDPKRWTTVVEDDDGTALYVEVETAFFAKRPDGNHAFLNIMSFEMLAKQKFKIFTRYDINMSRRTSRITDSFAFNEKGEMDERIRYNPEQKKVTPIRPKSNLFHVYQLALQQFVIRKLLPKDAVSAFENPDPKRWVQVPSLDGICYLEVKNAAFPNEDDGPHAIFWFQKKLLVPEETKEHVLFNVDINLTAKTQRLFDFAMINEQGEFIKGISWTELTHKLQPISPRSEMRLMYQIILGRYAAEKVIPSEGALVFRKPDPERWLLVYDGDEIDEVSIYINTVNTVFYKDHDGVHAVFWYQVIPPAHERFRLRTLARFRMNLTKKTYYVSDTVEFDDEGQVEGSYTHEPEEIEVESVSPGTVMEDIYNYLLERSKSAEMVEMKAQEQKKETGAKKTKKVKRKKTYGKTKRSRKK